MLKQIIDHYRKRYEQWQIKRETEIQEFIEKLDKEREEHIKEMCKRHCEEFLANMEEFGMDSEFLEETCKICGDGEKKHCEIMRERGLSGKHEECGKFFLACYEERHRRREEREKWKFWKHSTFKRKKTRQEREQELLMILPLIRAMQPDDWQQTVDAIKENIRRETD